MIYLPCHTAGIGNIILAYSTHIVMTNGKGGIDSVIYKHGRDKILTFKNVVEFENVTYKPNCAVAMIDKSPKLEVAYALSRMGKHVKIKDRYSVIIEVMKEYGDAFTYETIN